MIRILSLLLILSAPLAHGAPPPQRIVSLNLCTDQLLLLLVQPGRIGMLSQLAADSSLSWQAARAAGIPRFDGSVESVMNLQPELILSGSLAAVGTTGLLRRLGYRVETLDMPESIADSLDFIRRVATLLGEQSAGEQMARNTREHLQTVRQTAAANPHPLALIYLPNGVSPGQNTLKHELLETAGLRNLAAEQGIRGYGSIALESVLLATPQLLILDGTDNQHTSMAQQLLHHPALRGRVIQYSMPSSTWICGGPQIAEAADQLFALRRDAQAAAAAVIDPHRGH